MHKVLLIAQRDYLQIVRSKAYLFGLILLPLLIGGGFLMVSRLNRGSAKEQRIAILDRTGVSASAVIEAWKDLNRRQQANPANVARTGPRFTFEDVKPEADDENQILALTGRIRSGELFLVLDIPASALRPSGDAKQPPIRYYSNATGLDQSVSSLLYAVNNGLRSVRLAQLGLDAGRISEIAREVPMQPMNLLSRDPATGRISAAGKRNTIAEAVVPFFLVYLLIMVVLFGAAPQLGAVAEDKMQRVFEMLLSSATPFELMAGKVLAALGASLTSSIVYVVAGLAVLTGMAMFGFAPLHVLPWFFIYLVGDVAMLAALGVAIGSACASSQDAQQYAWVLVLPTVIPIFVATSIMQQPNSAFAVAMSFLPPFTPVLMLLRQALPGGVPWWQPVLGLAGMAAWGIATIWAAARIFRIGILAQGKTPKMAELVQWVVRG